MAKKKKKSEVEFKMLSGQDAQDHVDEQQQKAKPKVQVSKPPVVAGRKYSFNHWAAARGKKLHHIPGLRAFCKDHNKHRTIEEWDKVFKSY